MLLDELLGPNRNLINKEKYCKKKHASVCKYMLVSFCPYTLLQSIKFTNKSCKFTNHDKGFIKLYEESDKPFLKEYENDLLKELNFFYFDLKNKIKKENSIKKFIFELKIKEKLKEIKELINKNKSKENAFLIMNKYNEVKELKNEIYFLNENIICDCGKEISHDLPEEYYLKHKNGKYHKGMIYFLNKFNELIIKNEYS